MYLVPDKHPDLWEPYSAFEQSTALPGAPQHLRVDRVLKEKATRRAGWTRNAEYLLETHSYPAPPSTPVLGLYPSKPSWDPRKGPMSSRPWDTYVADQAEAASLEAQSKAKARNELIFGGGTQRPRGGDGGDGGSGGGRGGGGGGGGGGELPTGASPTDVLTALVSAAAGAAPPLPEAMGLGRGRGKDETPSLRDVRLDLEAQLRAVERGVQAELKPQSLQREEWAMFKGKKEGLRDEVLEEFP
jgi:hypothetical protein